MHGRWLAAPLRAAFAKPYVHVLFGARQTGKSTLLRDLLPRADLWIDLANPAERSRFLARPELLVETCEAMRATPGPARVVIDEAQAVPELFDAVQHLYDRDKSRFRFVLSGSSARKLRRGSANLLPGRSVLHRLYPLTLAERPAPTGGGAASGSILPLPDAVSDPFPAAPLLERLVFGELPGISLAPEGDRQDLLRAYSYVYLEEELRREALIKSWATFARFLRLAATESGQIVNYARIARQAGTSIPTVKSHYELLQDMFIGFTVDAYSGSPRKHVLSTPRFLFFDVGVRHAAAELSNSADTVLAHPGPIFEQWVGIELWKRIRYLGRGHLYHFRTKDGAEIDFIVDTGKAVIPVEVKWAEDPGPEDARQLRLFLAERPRRADHGYVVCRCTRPRRIAENVTAIPWWAI